MGGAGMGPPGAGPDMSKYKMPMILGIVGGVLALVGTFLPWVNACTTTLGLTLCIPFSGIGISGLPSGGPAVSPILGLAPILVLLFGIIGLVLMLLKKPMMAMVAMIMGLLVFVFCLWWYVSASPIFITVASVSIGAGIGVWLSLIGGLLLLVGGFLGWKALKVAAPAAAPAKAM